MKFTTIRMKDTTPGFPYACGKWNTHQRFAIKEPWQAYLKGRKVDVRNFDPRAWHCMYPVKKGVRYAAVFYALNYMERLTKNDWKTLTECVFSPGVTSSQVISTIKAAYSKVDAQDNLTKPPDDDSKTKEIHERSGHMPKDSECGFSTQNSPSPKALTQEGNLEFRLSVCVLKVDN
eukprot:6487553-Amphidinium_carterae.1